MSLLLLLNPQPLPTPTGLNPDVELDTMLVSMNSPESHVEADWLATAIEAIDPTATVEVDPPGITIEAI